MGTRIRHRRPRRQPPAELAYTLDELGADLELLVHEARELLLRAKQPR